MQGNIATLTCQRSLALLKYYSTPHFCKLIIYARKQTLFSRFGREISVKKKNGIESVKTLALSQGGKNPPTHGAKPKKSRMTGRVKWTMIDLFIKIIYRRQRKTHHHEVKYLC